MSAGEVYFEHIHWNINLTSEHTVNNKFSFLKTLMGLQVTASMMQCSTQTPALQPVLLTDTCIEMLLINTCIEMLITNTCIAMLLTDTCIAMLLTNTCNAMLLIDACNTMLLTDTCNAASVAH